MYLAGTQDPHAALRYLRERADDPRALFVPYIRQFLELCDSLAADGIVISTSGPSGRKKTDKFTFYNAPNPLRSAKGLGYDLGQVLYGLLVFAVCVIHRPQVVFVGDGIMHYVTIPLLRLSGARVILTFHNTLWASCSEKPDRWRAVARLCRCVFTAHVAAIMSASSAINDQFVEVTNGRCKPLLEFLPTYRPGTFDAIPEPSTSGNFRILYVGRIIREKGVFNLVRVAAKLRDQGHRDVEIHICGEGSAERDLVAAIEQFDPSPLLRFRGQCDASKMLDMYAKAHIIIVPTAAEFREGFNQVVAEATLAGRPVVASRACPAVRYLDGAVIVVEPDDIDGYVNAIKAAYRMWRESSKARLPEQIKERFFDPAHSWMETAHQAMTHND
jgi:glycogen(starch) synthase